MQHMPVERSSYHYLLILIRFRGRVNRYPMTLNLLTNSLKLFVINKEDSDTSQVDQLSYLWPFARAAPAGRASK